MDDNRLNYYNVQYNNYSFNDVVYILSVITLINSLEKKSEG